MFHQTKGTNIFSVVRDQEIRTSPRFYITGKSQRELESELVPQIVRGQAVYQYRVDYPNGKVSMLIWEKGERPAVWLTVEHTPIHVVGRPVDDAKFQEAEAAYGGFFRIGIDTAKVELFPWREFEHRTRVSQQWRRSLAQCGDDTSKWYFSLAPIPSSAWTVIERWDTSQWVPWQPDLSSSERARPS